MDDRFTKRKRFTDRSFRGNSNAKKHSKDAEMDNIDVANLTKVNELALRHGVKPYEFIATLSNNPDMDYCGLTFQVPAETRDQQRVKVKQMLNSIGVDDTGVLKGGEIALIDALDGALHRAPKSRSR